MEFCVFVCSQSSMPGNFSTSSHPTSTWRRKNTSASPSKMTRESDKFSISNPILWWLQGCVTYYVIVSSVVLLSFDWPKSVVDGELSLLSVLSLLLWEMGAIMVGRISPRDTRWRYRWVFVTRWHHWVRDGAESKAASCITYIRFECVAGAFRQEWN